MHCPESGWAACADGAGRTSGSAPQPSPLAGWPQLPPCPLLAGPNCHNLLAGPNRLILVCCWSQPPPRPWFAGPNLTQIPVSSINIGPINKKDVMRANAMIERGYKKFGVILAFDVPGESEAGVVGVEGGGACRQGCQQRAPKANSRSQQTKTAASMCVRDAADRTSPILQRIGFSFSVLTGRLRLRCRCPPAVTREAATLAEQLGVRIFTADIIYHLFDQFTAYLKQARQGPGSCAGRQALALCLVAAGSLPLTACTSRNGWLVPWLPSRGRFALFAHMAHSTPPVSHIVSRCCCCPCCAGEGGGAGGCQADCGLPLRAQDPAHLHLQPEGPHHSGRGGG